MYKKSSKKKLIHPAIFLLFAIMSLKGFLTATAAVNQFHSGTQWHRDPKKNVPRAKNSKNGRMTRMNRMRSPRELPPIHHYEPSKNNFSFRKSMTRSVNNRSIHIYSISLIAFSFVSKKVELTSPKYVK